MKETKKHCFNASDFNYAKYLRALFQELGEALDHARKVRNLEVSWRTSRGNEEPMFQVTIKKEL